MLYRHTHGNPLFLLAVVEELVAQQQLKAMDDGWRLHGDWETITGLVPESLRRLIDQQLGRMSAELEKVSRLVTDLEKDRAEKYGQLTTHLKTTSEQTAALVQSTNTLREALASTKVRGQWGERMAEDVLRLAGFLEKIN